MLVTEIWLIKIDCIPLNFYQNREVINKPLHPEEYRCRRNESFYALKTVYKSQRRARSQLV